MYPDTPELISTLQAYWELYGDAGIDHLVSQIDGYGEPVDVPVWGAPDAIGARTYGPLTDLVNAYPQHLTLPTKIICVLEQPSAPDPDAEAQRMANVQMWNVRQTVGAMSGADMNRDGVSDRLSLPRQGVNHPGNSWPDLLEAKVWTDVTKAPSQAGTSTQLGTMVFKHPEAAVESTRLVIIALENGGVTPG